MSRRSYIVMLAVIFFLLVMMQIFIEEPVDWSPSYSKYHKKPFGSYILFQLLNDLFPEAQIQTSHATVAETLDELDSTDEQTCFIFSAGYLSMYESEVTSLLDFVREGNYAFLAAEEFSSDLLDTLQIETKFFSFSLFKDTTVNLLLNDESSCERTHYPFRKGIGNYYFQDYPCDAKELSTDETGRVVTLLIPFGKGSLVLNTFPTAFTNYYLLNDTTNSYIAKTLSYFPENVSSIIWDEFYRTGRSEAQTPLRFILTTPPLKWAWYVLLSLTILYILSEVKRRQRMIPVLEPLRNSTLEFVSTVGRLYFQQGNHKDLANKKLNYFLDELRRKYFLRTIDFSESSADKVAMKSGIPVEDVRGMFRYFEKLGSGVIDEIQLRTLNNVIENFLRKAK